VFHGFRHNFNGALVEAQVPRSLGWARGGLTPLASVERRREPAVRRTMLNISDLKERGWTQGLIKRFLGEPDATRPNRYRNRRRSPVKLYQVNRVTELEASPEFAAAKSKAMARSKAATEAAHRRAASLLAEVDAIEIAVTRISLPTLRRAAMRGKFKPNGSGRVRRWMVNHARHNLTEYDAIIEGLFAKVGKRQAYKLVKVRTLQAIATVYPELADECRVQAERTLSLRAF
jgi:hypothetical protein